MEVYDSVCQYNVISLLGVVTDLGFYPGVTLLYKVITSSQSNFKGHGQYVICHPDAD